MVMVMIVQQHRNRTGKLGRQYTVQYSVGLLHRSHTTSSCIPLELFLNKIKFEIGRNNKCGKFENKENVTGVKGRLGVGVRNVGNRVTMEKTTCHHAKKLASRYSDDLQIGQKAMMIECSKKSWWRLQGDEVGSNPTRSRLVYSSGIQAETNRPQMCRRCACACVCG